MKTEVDIKDGKLEFEIAFREWLSQHNIESNFTTKLKDYKEFLDWVNEELDDFGNRLKKEGDKE